MGQALAPLRALARHAGLSALDGALGRPMFATELATALHNAAEAELGPWTVYGKPTDPALKAGLQRARRAVSIVGVTLRDEQYGSGPEATQLGFYDTPRGSFTVHARDKGRSRFTSLHGDLAALLAIDAVLLGLVDRVRPPRHPNPAEFPMHTDDPGETAALHERQTLSRLGLRDVGLNADWAVSAYPLTGKNGTQGAVYLLDNEDGTWTIARRWYPEEPGFQSESGEEIEEVMSFPSLDAAAIYIEDKRAGRPLRPNPMFAKSVSLARKMLAHPATQTALREGAHAAGRALQRVNGGDPFWTSTHRTGALEHQGKDGMYRYFTQDPHRWGMSEREAALQAKALTFTPYAERWAEYHLGDYATDAAARARIAAHEIRPDHETSRDEFEDNPRHNPGHDPDELIMQRIAPAIHVLSDGWKKGWPVDSAAAMLPDVGVLPWSHWSAGARFFDVPDRYARAVWEEVSIAHPERVRENPRRQNRANPGLSGLAERDGLSALATWLRGNAAALQAALQSPDVEIVGAGAEARTASKRRVQAFAALAILRRAQREAAANHGAMPLLSPSERATLATWSGLGGLFRSCSELKPDEVTLLRADQQEYCRLDGERAIGRARGRTEAELPQIPMELTFAFEGMIAQYFTPEHVAEGMCRRAVACWESTNEPIRPLRVLEPSAGSGRMVQGWRRANLGAAQWTLVEWDSDQADLLQLVYGVSTDYRVFPGPIEQYVAEFPPSIVDNRVDLVIANPPYADRRKPSRKADRPYEDVKENQNYFVLRSLDYLRPRGVTIQLVPWGILTDTRGEDQRVRTELLKRAHFFGAVELPSDVFPGSLQNVVLLVLGKRPVPLAAVLPEDQAINDGKWLQRPVPEGPEGPHMGHIKESSRNYRGGVLRTGDFDYAKLAEYTDRKPHQSYFEEVKATPAEIAASKAVRNDRLGISVADVVRIGELLGSRCIAVREARVQNAEKARGLLIELRPDLTDYVARFGLPRAAKLPDGYRPSASWFALASAFNPDGTFSELIGNEVAGPVSNYKGDGTPADVVRFLSARNGFATQDQVESILGHGVRTLDLLLHPDVYWYPERDDGELCYLRKQEFLSGPCWDRMEWIRVQRDQGFSYSWRNRPEIGARDLASIIQRAAGMADLLLAAIAPKAITDIDIGIRSEWLYDVVDGEADTRDASILLEWMTAMVKATSKGAELVMDSLKIVKGKMIPDGTHLFAPIVQDVCAYYNRDEMVDKIERGKKKEGRRNSGDLAERIKADTEKDQKFAAFVRAHPRAHELSLRYNRAYRGFVARKYDESEIQVARFNPEDPEGNRVTIRPYIWASVRRAVERRGGIMALDVGLGKTFAAILTAAAMRESGKARRIMVAVPNSVGPNWIMEVSRILPDYRVLPLGFSPKMIGSKLRSTADSVETVTRKLSDFAAGLYDICIVQHSTLARFGVTEARAKELLSARLTSSRAIADELAALREKAQEIADLKRTIELLTAKAEYNEEARTDLIAAKEKLETLTGADIKKLTEHLDKLEGEVKGLTRQGLMEEQERATTQKDLDRIAAQLVTFDEIEETRRRIQRKQSVAQATIRNQVDDAIALESYIADRIPEPAVRGITFDELGVDLLIVDEAHNFKNLYGAATRYGQKLKYMGALDAEKVTSKCWDLLIKCLSVRERNNQSGILLLTATPLKNSPLEAYALLSYCTDEAWSRRGIAGPENFIDRFCVGQPEPVLKVDGRFDYQLAVNKFTNLDELRAIFSEWVDVKAAMRRGDYDAAVNAGRDPGANIVPLDLPADVSIEHMIPMTKLIQQQYDAIRQKLAGDAEQSVGELCAQAKVGLSEAEQLLVDSGQVDLSALDELKTEGDLPLAANPKKEKAPAGPKKESKGGEVLKAMDQMTKLATDPGLMGFSDPEAEIPRKYVAVAEQIAKSRAGNGDCAHIVFSDYNETHAGLKAAIVRIAGIPAARIKLVTGALSVGQRQQVVDGFNGTWDSKTKSYIVEPEYDVVIGNTPTMGEGLNLQQRACSIHHVTLPWEPASIQQRNGRGVRQGNRTRDQLVSIHYYLTERSFDGYKLSLIKGKRAWMVGLLESAAKTTNNPGASMGGPCAILRALAADPEAADKACQCLEAAGAIREIARRKSSALQDFAAYIGAHDAARKAREEDTRRYYGDQALALRQKLERMGPSIFPYRDWLDKVATVRALVIPATGRVLIEGAWYLIGGEVMLVTRINLDSANLFLRGIGAWHETLHSTGDFRIVNSEIAPVDPPTQEEQEAALSKSFPTFRSPASLIDGRAIIAAYPAMFLAKVTAGLRSGRGSVMQLTIPAIGVDATGAPSPLAWTSQVYAFRGISDPGEVLLPTSAEDAERYLKAIRRLPREVRISKRANLKDAYEGWFGRTYPKDLREEEVRGTDEGEQVPLQNPRAASALPGLVAEDWDEWPRQIVWEEALGYANAMRGDWPDSEVELDRAVEAAMARITRWVDDGNECDQTWFDRYEDGAIEDEVRTAIRRYHQTMPGPRSNPAEKIAPVSDAGFTLREAAKQLVLLEDHLVQPDKACGDCIRKHLLAIEGLAEEARALAPSGPHADRAHTLALAARSWWTEHTKGQSSAAIAARVRDARKKLVGDIADVRVNPR